jgi:serine/threonine protein kinase HipA of HipAB toxin-antitoxin module
MSDAAEPVLPPGVYERLLDQELQDALAAHPELKPIFGKLDDEESPQAYAQFILEVLTRALRACSTEQRLPLVNGLVALIGATDGHAKNFSIFLGPLGRFRLTPLYDILSAQPSLATGQIHKKQMRLAMFAGTNRHYVVDRIRGRHFTQTTERAGVSSTLAEEVLQEVLEQAPRAKELLEKGLPADFPELLHRTIWEGVASRLGNLRP